MRLIRIVGYALVIFGVLVLMNTVMALSSVPYTKTEYWKVDKTVHPATAGIINDYQEAYLCNEDWEIVDQLFLPITAGHTRPVVEAHLVSALSAYKVREVLSKNEDGSYYYFVLSREYYGEVDGTIELTTYGVDGTKFAGEVSYMISQRGGCLRITHAVQNPLEVTVAAGTYDVWAVADEKRSQNATVTVADGGTSRVNLTLLSQTETYVIPEIGIFGILSNPLCGTISLIAGAVMLMKTRKAN